MSVNVRINPFGDDGLIFVLQTNELVVSLDQDEKLILQNDQTLRAAGVGTNSVCLLWN